ncbi:MAG: GntR family transcriptional regulator [Paucimonas sp.]|jgi:GntR family transcriptional regulator|nr:GntR family transcriptional regulator [Paucimonas sp.]
MPNKFPILFSVATGSGEPIYKQIVDQVRRMVASGQLSAGDELPSVRDVAQSLAVNPMTISKAYSLAEAAGILERRRGLGMFVAPQHEKPQKLQARIELLRPALERAAEQTHQLEIEHELALNLFKKILGENK